LITIFNDIVHAGEPFDFTDMGPATLVSQINRCSH
jgi:hypothetical protein